MWNIKSESKTKLEIKNIMNLEVSNRIKFHKLMDLCEAATGKAKVMFLEAAYTLDR